MTRERGSNLKHCREAFGISSSVLSTTHREAKRENRLQKSDPSHGGGDATYL